REICEGKGVGVYAPDEEKKRNHASSCRHVPGGGGRKDGLGLERSQCLGKRFQVSISKHGNRGSRRGIHDVSNPRHHELLPNIQQKPTQFRISKSKELKLLFQVLRQL